MEFLLKDYVVLLAGALLIGGVVLLFLVINNIFNAGSSVPKDLQDEDTEDANAEEAGESPVQEEGEASLVEAHLNSMSEEVTELKKKLEKLEKLEKSGADQQGATGAQGAATPTVHGAPASFGAEIDQIKDQLTKLNAKMDAIYHVLSALGKH